MSAARRLPGAPTNEERRSHKGVVTLAVAISLAALVAYLLWPAKKAPEPEARPRRAEETTAKADARERVRLGAPPAAASAGPAPSDSIDPNWDPSNPPGSERTKPISPSAPYPYPPGSQPLTELVDPMSQQKEDNTVDAETGIRCIFGPRVAVVHPPDPMVIDLEVRNKLDAKLPITSGYARFRADKTTIEKGPWFPVDFVDDGAGKDLAANDLSYTATFLPNEAQRAAFFKGGSHVFVEVSFEAPNQLGKRTYSTAMQYAREPSARLNGKYDEAIESGSLVIKAGVTADKAGQYRVIGSLFGEADETAIAFASKAVHLDAGDGQVPLLFFGKILHDKGVDGPYDLRYVMLFEEIIGSDVIPGEKVDHAYTTKPYKAADFSPDAYSEPAPDYPIVDMNDPSQKDKPPPLYGEKDRATTGNNAPIKADPQGKTPSHTFTPGTPGYGK